MVFLRIVNRNRLWISYKLECVSMGIEPICKAQFYKWYSDRMFKDMTRQTCCCTLCVDNGDVTFEMLRELLSDLCKLMETTMLRTRIEYIDTIENLQLYYERYYRGELERSCTDINRCMTWALSTGSHGDDSCFHCACDHEHVSDSNGTMLLQDVGLIESLRVDIKGIADAEEKACLTWRLQQVEGLLIK